MKKLFAKIFRRPTKELILVFYGESKKEEKRYSFTSRELALNTARNRSQTNQEWYIYCYRNKKLIRTIMGVGKNIIGEIKKRNRLWNYMNM